MKYFGTPKKLIISAAPFSAIVLALVIVLAPMLAVAGTWTDQTASGTRSWFGVAMSSDGTTIVAADNSSSSANLYRSDDSGVTWNAITAAGARQWKYVACSSDCSTILASEQSGDLWLWNGSTWTDQTAAGSHSWTSVAVSADGSVLAASGNPGGIWAKIGGGSWTNVSALTPNTLAMSGDGTKMAMGLFGGNIYTSPSPFTSWTERDQQGGTHFWTSIALSNDGSKVVASAKFGDAHIWTASTFPFSSAWTERSGAGTGGAGQWQAVTSSSDGTRLMAVAFGGDVKTSTDSGANWTTQTGPGTTVGWKGAASSSDGRFFAIGGTTTDIWTYADPIVVAPTVTSSAASSITTTTATLNGNITVSGGENATARGFHWGTTTGYGSTLSTSGSFSTGAFTGTLTGLTCNTTYHYEAFATNGAGTGVSTPDVSFTTSACPVAPTVTTGTATSFTSATAVLAGTITVTGGATPTSRYFEYGLTTSYGSTLSTSGSYSTGSFVQTAHGLTAGTLYHFRACATNTAGSDCGSDATFTTLAAPGAPTSLGGTAQYTQVALTWAAPSSSGDYAITDYLIEYKPTAGSVWSPFSHTASTATAATVTGLANGTAYDFRVSAVNYAGPGTASSTISRTPSSTPTAPNPPTGLSGTGASGSVVLTWVAPSNTGGASVTDYAVQYKASTATSWTTFSDGVSTSTGATVTGLTNGLGYWFRVAAVNSVGTGSYSDQLFKAAGTSVYLHILSTGQSLAEGVNASPTLSTSQPYNNKMLSSNVFGISTPLIPLVEGSVETPASGLANSLRASDSVLTRPIIVSIHAGGGQTYSSIKKGGTGPYYAKGQTQASVAKGEVEGLSAFYQPLAVTIVHGEADAINGVASATYAGYMQEMQADYESDWNALTGMTGTIPLFESQMNSNSLGTIPVGQLMAHRNNPGKIILVGPKYQLPYSLDHVHITNTASKYLGEMYAKVMKKVLVDGTTWNPLMPKSVTRVGNIVTIDYYIPTGTLAIDTTTVTAHTNYGFEFVQTGGTTTISSVALTDSNRKVQITLSGVPDGTDPHIRYAWNCEQHPGEALYSVCGDPTDSTYNGGNIRDTDTSVSPSSDGTGLALYDWGVTFDEPIVEPSGPAAPTGLSATADNTQVALSWTAPAVTNGAAISDYVIEYKTRAATTWSTFSDGTSTATSATVTSLTNGTNYMFRVSAANAYDTGLESSTVPATPATLPGAPTSLAGTSGQNGQVPLTWVPPASNGGAEIYDYFIEYKTSAATSWTTFSDGISISTGATVTGLTNSTAYDFRVSAINPVGTGTASTTASATPAASVPDAPTGLSATAGNGQVALIWVTPASDGGFSITDYLVEYKTSAATSWTTFADGTSTATGATVTSLSNGTAYDFRVSAITTAGTGNPSNTATATPATTPGAPTSLAATAGNTQAVLTWIPPVSNGGAFITDYVVEYKTSAATSWTTFSDGTSTATGATVTGLTNGTAYDFRVSATNSIGTGSASSTASATPVTTPGAPTSLAATGGNTQVSLVWVAPASTGGSAITDYLVEYKPSAGATWFTFSDGTSTATSATVTSLSNGTAYDFRVSAINLVGTGTASSTASATPATTPGAPTSLAATAGNAQASLTWIPPVSNGGASITDYVVEYKLNADSSWTTFSDGTSTSTGATVTGLMNGSLYNFRVSASNSSGTGTPSSTANATPVTTPGAPSALTATPSSTQVALSWTAPSTGGSAITDYVVEYKLSTDSSWTTFSDGVGTTASATVTGLTNALAYDFRVSATNAVGTGSVSSTVSATPAAVPGAPTALVATAGAAQVSLTWTAPVSNGGAAITDYVVEYKLTADASWTVFSDGTSATASATVTGLSGGSSYDFRVSAVNTTGAGTASDPASATPTVPVSSSSGNRAAVPVWAISRPVALIPETSTGGGASYLSPLDLTMKACPAFTKNIKYGSKLNDVEQVRLLQAFLNKEMSQKIPLTGFYGPLTFASTKAFQEKYRAVILDPQGIKNPTGMVAGGTRAKANALLGCKL